VPLLDCGGRTRTRTRDLRFWRPPLYRLSYTPPPARDDTTVLRACQRSRDARRRSYATPEDRRSADAWYPRDVLGIVSHALRSLRPLAVAAALAIIALVTLDVPTAAQGGAGNVVWIVPIEGEINAATAQFVRARIDRANREMPLALLFAIDSPGGEIGAMQRIVSDILNRSEVPVLAVVRNAFSAAALVAMSAEQLAMLPGSAIGAALPIALTPTGIQTVDEKFASAVRGEFRAVAEARGRDPRVAEAMVDQRIEIPGLSTDRELLTLTAGQAVEYDIADIEARTIQDALERFGYGGARVERLEPNLTERLGSFLVNPIVIALLLVIGVGGLVIEFFTPGFGVAGGLGVLALALLAMTAFVATPANIYDVLLILLGIVLLAVEALVLPGFGVAGVLGIGVLAFAIFRIFQESWVFVFGYSAVFAGVLIGAMLWFLPNSRFASAFRLSTRIGRSAVPSLAESGRGGERIDLVGAQGVAISDLRPAGVARIEDERIDVVTQGDFIPTGARIKVLRVEGNRVTVRAIEAPASSTAASGAEGSMPSGADPSN
jgi:membrane-bound serine protease (ClpP class)